VYFSVVKLNKWIPTNCAVYVVWICYAIIWIEISSMDWLLLHPHSDQFLFLKVEITGASSVTEPLHNVEF
jgi:hypothetical protein